MSSTAANLQNIKWQNCIDACMRCAKACEFCAASDWKEQDVKMMASCAQMNRECGAVCWTSASLMSMDSQFVKQFCRLCADVCDVCAQGTMLITVKDAPKCVGIVPMNVKACLEDNREEMVICDLLVVPRLNHF